MVNEYASGGDWLLLMAFRRESESAVPPVMLTSWAAFAPTDPSAPSQGAGGDPYSQTEGWLWAMLWLGKGTALSLWAYEPRCTARSSC
jgi:hypothetical protein